MILRRIRTLRPFFVGLASVLFMVFIVGGLTLAFQLHNSSPAFAASCNSSKAFTSLGICGGGNPLTTGCFHDATTLPMSVYPISDARNKKLGTIELRFSKACQTAWARVISLGGTVYGLEALVSTRGASLVPGQYSSGEALNGVGNVRNNPNLMFSGMLPAPHGAQLTACGTILPTQPQGFNVCTPPLTV
jgi:hypothetical protein